MNKDDYIQEELVAGEEQEEVSLAGYQVAKAEFFAHTREPAVTVWDNKIKFNMACLRKFPGVKYIQLLIHRWASGGGESERKNRDMICQMFAAKLFDLMEWNKECRYKMLGKPAVYNGEALYLFKLNDFEMFVNNGTKKRRSWFPEDWRECFGVPFEEHDESYKIDLAEGYISTDKMGEVK